MVKWVRKQLQALRLYGGSDTSSTTLVGGNLRRTVMVAALMPRVSKRMATISSVGFAPWSKTAPLALTSKLPPGVIRAVRRPGVDSRWKEQNRLAFKRAL